MKLTNAVEFYSCLDVIMNHYGRQHQIFEKLPEEAVELVEAYFHHSDHPSDVNWYHIIEEAADVYVMLEQFQMLISPEEKKIFDKICMEKVRREVGRIEKAGGAK